MIITDAEIFQIAHDYIMGTQGQAFEYVKETLIGLTAVIGTVMVNASGGEWRWDPKTDICWVSRKEKYPRMVFPLGTVIRCWREKAEQSFEKISNECKYIKNKIG